MQTQGKSPAQPRAAETRQNIIDAGVDLFIDYGYAETRLNDIVERAVVTTGAFYYHFGSKEALAGAIMEQGWPKAVAVISESLQTPVPGLERVILMTFALSSLMKSDRSVWIANHLNQAFGQLSEGGRRAFKDHAEEFVDLVAGVVKTDDLSPQVTPTDVGNMVWITVHGCHLLSDAMMDDVIDRLARSWQIMLCAMAPTESLDYFQQFVVRTAKRYKSG